MTMAKRLQRMSRPTGVARRLAAAITGRTGSRRAEAKRPQIGAGNIGWICKRLRRQSPYLSLEHVQMESR
jgi:hypothetical protein